MCLESNGLDELKEPVKKIQYGYKVFDGVKGKYYFPYEPLAGKHLVLRGRWLHSSDIRIVTFSWAGGRHKTYPSGFHIFKYKKDALRWNCRNRGVVVRVRFRNLVATGYQRPNYPCLVAKEMFVPEEKQNEKKNSKRRRSNLRVAR